MTAVADKPKVWVGMKESDADRLLDIIAHICISNRQWLAAGLGLTRDDEQFLRQVLPVLRMHL